MSRFLIFFIPCVLTLSLLISIQGADTPITPMPILPVTQAQGIQGAFEPFTGCIRRNKVRMRIGADVNSPIVSELAQGVLLEVVGEQEDFYAVHPPEPMKVYVYRTYVLNQQIDASRVNLRLEPSIDAPIVGQMHKGERAEGQVSQANDQWIEINLPDTIPLYVAKEFIEKVGPVEYLSNLSTVQARRKEAAAPMPMPMPTPMAASAPHLHHHAPPSIPLSMPDSMSSWIAREEQIFAEWRKQYPEGNMTAFYAAEQNKALPLKGIIQPYTRALRHRPGNFLLIHPDNGHPIAFLYSTTIDLQEHVGNSLSLLAVPRPNYNCAFPAFFILSLL